MVIISLLYPDGTLLIAGIRHGTQSQLGQDEVCYEVRILQSHTTITFIQSQGHKDVKNQHLL